MNKIRKSLKPFTQISNKILNDINLSLKAKGLFAFMDSKPEGWNFTIRSMSKQLKEGEDAIKSSLRELKELGYVKHIKFADGHGQYELIDDPKVENPHEDNPLKGKPTPISNKEPIVKKIDSNIKNKQKVDYSKFDNLSEKAMDMWLDYKGVKYTKQGITLTANKLKKFNEATQIKMVEDSIMNGWKGLFEPRQQTSFKGKQPQQGSLEWERQQMIKQQEDTINAELV